MKCVLLLFCFLAGICGINREYQTSESVPIPDHAFKLFSVDDPGYSVTGKWHWGYSNSNVKTEFHMGYIFVYMTIYPFRINATLSIHEKILFSDVNVVRNEYLPRYSGIIGNIVTKVDYGEYQKRQVMYVAINRDMNGVALFPRSWTIGGNNSDTNFTLELETEQTVMWPIAKGYSYGTIEP